MAFSINGSTFNLDLDTILIWFLVGLVAGFLASRVALGHGLGLFGDIIVGIIGAFIGGFLGGGFFTNDPINGHPNNNESIVAFLGAGNPPFIVGPGPPARGRPPGSLTVAEPP